MSLLGEDQTRGVTPSAMTPSATLTLSDSSMPCRPAKVSAAELVEAAIARTEAVNPTLNGLAYEAFDRARARANAPRPYGGYFNGVPSFIKDNVAVEGMPTMQGTDAWDPRPVLIDGEFARAYPGDGPCAAGQDAAVRVRFQRVGRASPARAGAQSVESRPHRGCLIVGIGGVCRRGRGADRARQRRRRLDPNPGVLQRISRTEAVAWPAAAGQGRAPDAVADRG